LALCGQTAARSKSERPLRKQPLPKEDGFVAADPSRVLGDGSGIFFYNLPATQSNKGELNRGGEVRLTLQVGWDKPPYAIVELKLEIIANSDWHGQLSPGEQVNGGC
jgi:hypothetical protein